MAGVMFVVCVPTNEHEVNLIENSRRKSVSSNTASDDITLQFSCNKPESPRSLKKSFPSTTENVSEKYQIYDNVAYNPYETKIQQEILTSTLNNDDVNPERSNSNCTLNMLNDARVTKSRLNYQDNKNDMAYHKEVKSDRSRNHEEFSRVNTKKGSMDWTKTHRTEATMPMEKVLDTLLKKLKIENAVWCAGESGQYFQVFFSVGSGERCEEILRHFSEFGIGVKLNSVVSVIPCTLYYQGKEQQPMDDGSPDMEHIDESRRKSSDKLSAWDKFVLSVRARLTVAQVVEGVRADAKLTFDFLVLLLISAFVAALGLVENSTVILVASMLISPLMGPIMAGTFGTVIGDRHLQKIGVLNELFGLLVCLLVGFFFGLIAGLANEHWGNAGWPTEEMISRGQIRSLWVGVLIALASGAAVAIAILGDNTGSLVGVAISASLMPPAVNAGLLWALACMDQLWQGRMQLENDDADAVRSYSPIYSDKPPVELAVLGAVSLCLTLVNIICIFLVGILVLKIKEVAPRTSTDHQQFWKHDIKIARDYNRTFQGEDAEELQKRLAEEIARTKLQSNLNGMTSHRYNGFQSLGSHRPYLGIQEIFNHPNMTSYHSQLTWSPSTAIIHERRPTLQDLEQIYATFSMMRGEGTAETQSAQHRKHTHSRGIHSTDHEVNQETSMKTANVPLTENSTVVNLPTISESKPRSLSDESGANSSTTTSCPSMLSEQFSSKASSSDSHFNEMRRFTVTLAQDPVVDK